jgi:hypothetical protein
MKGIYFNDGRFQIQRSSGSGASWSGNAMVISISGDYPRNITTSDGFILQNHSGTRLFDVRGNDGRANFSDNLSVNGSLSKGSGSFRIPHPLPEKENTHFLVHSFTESPFADLIYSGMVTLGDQGKATVNIDDASTMTRGTFEALTCNRRRSCTNEGGFTNIKSALNGNLLIIEAADPNCRDEIFWQVIGERCDKHMKNTDWTDEYGRVIVEPLSSD